MQLTAREKDKLLISMAATVARRRLERGVKLFEGSRVTSLRGTTAHTAGGEVRAGAVVLALGGAARALPELHSRLTITSSRARGWSACCSRAWQLTGPRQPVLKTTRTN